ncbi:glutathione S-transferase [Sinobacterium caligoides]|uniref:Glutathione S-transferase n=1 Tax=Sinobacterium caligoides TaxID=933926 RepID=A0A3N2DQE3_9GAMM|nr:glutathione S-transferase [Sinobacterium caligoides]ROS02046.1 glutathione S-transferase [Sinobacterium caligoides]
MSPAILYSLQHCPYAMRARLGLLLAEQTVLLRAVSLKDKPPELLTSSPKGTVPVLVVDNTTVIDESLEIMLWALHQNDPHGLLHSDDHDALVDMLSVIHSADHVFKSALESYKAAKRYHRDDKLSQRQACEHFLQPLEQNLEQGFLFGARESLVDYALLPFIRQFSRVERQWFRQAPYPRLQQWLHGHLQSRRYAQAMQPYPLWLEQRRDYLFGAQAAK